MLIKASWLQCPLHNKKVNKPSFHGASCQLAPSNIWTYKVQYLPRQYLLCIQPCIDHAISVWGTCSKQLKDMITRLQHRAARIVTGIFAFIKFRGANLLENLGWHSFDKRRDYFTATMMFKCINGLAPLRVTNELSVISDAHSANTRASSNGNILVPMPHVEQFRNSFKYRGAVLWNSLPRDIREAQNID